MCEIVRLPDPSAEKSVGESLSTPLAGRENQELPSSRDKDTVTLSGFSILVDTHATS